MEKRSACIVYHRVNEEAAVFFSKHPVWRVHYPVGDRQTDAEPTKFVR